MTELVYRLGVDYDHSPSHHSSTRIVPTMVITMPSTLIVAYPTGRQARGT
jgi:hypothetical protein